MNKPDPTVLIENDGGVRTLRLNRPDVLNAYNEPLLVDLNKALKEAERDAAVRCVIITGAGRAFCSGQDLAEVAEKYSSPEPIELGVRLRNVYHPVIARIRSMEKPVVAAVNGVAAGAGASLALACDIRIAADVASFVQAFVKVGLVPDCGSTYFLPRLVGAARAFEICCSGRKVMADEALAIGMVNRVVPAADLPTATREIAETLAALPPRAIGLTKRALNRAWASDLDAQLDYEAMLQTTAGRTRDHREGVVAFMEKRKPVFTGE